MKQSNPKPSPQEESELAKAIEDYFSQPKRIRNSTQGFTETDREMAIRIFKAGWRYKPATPTPSVEAAKEAERRYPVVYPPKPHYGPQPDKNEKLRESFIAGWNARGSKYSGQDQEALWEEVVNTEWGWSFDYPNQADRLNAIVNELKSKFTITRKSDSVKIETGKEKGEQK